jgi:hypothetical protein
MPPMARKAVRRFRGWKNLRQEATPSVSSPGAADVPVIVVSALLWLADRLSQPTRSTSGDYPCATAATNPSPPRRVAPPGLHPSVPIWPTLTADQQRILLHALGRLLARRLPAAPAAKEVRDERNGTHPAAPSSPARSPTPIGPSWPSSTSASPRRSRSPRTASRSPASTPWPSTPAPRAGPPSGCHDPRRWEQAITQRSSPVRPRCGVRRGAVSYEDGDHRNRERLTTAGRVADNCPMCKR